MSCARIIIIIHIIRKLYLCHNYIMSLQSMSSKDEKPIGKDLEVILTIDEVSARMHGCMYECINF